MNEKTAAVQSFTDMCALVTELAGREVQHPSSFASVYDAGFTSFNWYSRVCLDAFAEEQFPEAVSLLSDSSLPLVSFTEGTIPESFADRLKELRYEPMVTQTGMILDEEHLQALVSEMHAGNSDSDPGAGSAALVRLGRKDMDAYSDTVARAFEKPDDRSAFYLMSEHDDCYFYGYKENEALIGTTLLYTRNGNAGLHEVSVLQEYRRRGIAAVLVRHALQQAASDGAAFATLQASPLGKPLYETLGFREVSRIQTWICPRKIPMP